VPDRTTKPARDGARPPKIFVIWEVSLFSTLTLNR
jgi:hypothetical protein